MTREEEYTQAASDYILSQVVPVGSEKLAYGDFINGVKWADEHPKEGLWDAQKVIEWLNSVDFSKYVEELKAVYVGRLKDDLIKAMAD